MSWNITVYAEKKNKETGKWDLVSCVHDNFKWNLSDIKGHGGVSWSEFESIKLNEISDGLKKDFHLIGNELDDYLDAKMVSIKDLREYADKMISKSIEAKKMLFLALGMPEYTDDEYADIYDVDKYDKDGNINKAWNPLTFPISKTILEKVQTSEFDAIKGYRIIGMIDATEAMCSYDDEIRFIMIGG